MFKFLFRLILFVVVIAVVAVGGAIFYVDTIAKSAIERGGEYALGVRTSVDDVSVNLLGGEFGLGGLSIANPPGFDAGSFFELGSAKVSVDTATLLGDKIRAPLFALDRVHVRLEKNKSGSNYQAILKNLEKFESAEPAETEASSKLIVIDELSITDITADVTMASFIGKPKKVDVKIPEIRLRNVGSDGSGVDMAELSSIVTKAVLEAIVRAGGLPGEMVKELQAGLADLTDLSKLGIDVTEKLKGVEALGDKLKGDVADKLGSGLTEKLGEGGGDEIGKVIDGLFGGRKKSEE